MNNLMAQESTGVFTARTLALLPTLEIQLKTQLREARRQITRTRHCITRIGLKLTVKTEQLTGWINRFKQADRKLAFIDGRAKKVSVRRTYRKTTGIIDPVLATKKELSETIKLMSDADKAELLKDLLMED